MKIRKQEEQHKSLNQGNTKNNKNKPNKLLNQTKAE